MRKLCLGENASAKSVWKDTNVRKKEGVGEDEHILFGRVASEERWKIPREGVLEFKFIACGRCNVQMNGGWVTSIVAMLEACTNDIARVAVIRNVKDQHFGLKTSTLRVLLNCVETKVAKRECFGLLLDCVEDMLNGGIDLASEIDFDGGKRVLQEFENEGIAMVQTPRKDKTIVVSEAMKIKLKQEEYEADEEKRRRDIDEELAIGDLQSLDLSSGGGGKKDGKEDGWRSSEGVEKESTRQMREKTEKATAKWKNKRNRNNKKEPPHLHLVVQDKLNAQTAEKKRADAEMFAPWSPSGSWSPSSSWRI